jgi:tagatose 6-phosphate kinase
MTVLTVTLNAAIDKRYDVSDVRLGAVQRVIRVRAGAGGKGLNVARGARLCGHEVAATGFVAGFAGQFISSQVEAQGIRDEFVRVPGESRTCINIIDTAGTSTEFLEPGITVDASQVALLLAKYQSLLDGVDVVTISGSAPSGCTDDVYVAFVEAARRAGRPVILDTSGVALRAGLAAGPTVVKPNREELAELAGMEVPDLACVVAAARALCDRGPEWVVVSLGAEGAVAVNAARAVQVLAPRVDAVNPVGCGDVLVAGLATELAAGHGVDAALPFAVRVATAAAAHPETGCFDPGFAETLRTTTISIPN